MATRMQIEAGPAPITYPVSPIQEGMLFHSLYGRQPGVDVTQIICDWQEEVDVSAFNGAWQKLAERHSILRTGFSWEASGSPRQQIYEQVQIPVAQKDWSAMSPSAQAEQFSEFMRVERKADFEFASPPLLRVTLISLGLSNYRFVLTIHHAITDARTLVILLNDLFAFYESFQTGEEPQLQSAPDYVRYVEWHQRQDWSEAESFWRKRLAGFTAPTALPLQGYESNGSLSEWAEEEAILNSGVVTTLRDTGRAHALTLNTFLQGAWAIVLSRYSGEDDVIFGAVKSCRPAPITGAINIAGPLINTLPVRVSCAPEQDVITWLKALRQQWVELRKFEHSPLAKIQSWSQAPPGHPLFQTILNVLDPPWDAVLRSRGGAWQKRNFRISNQPNYPIALDIYVAGEARLKLVYDSAVFQRHQMTRLLGHVRTVLESLAADPTQLVGHLQLLTERERVELLETWNDTTKNDQAAGCVPRLFEEQARLHPEALAVSSGEVQLTYHQLNERANRVAHRLHQLGIGPEARVGICMARSAENVVGLLGILKAGAAYVPLDPEHPDERLAFMISDADIHVLVSQRKWKAKFPATTAQVIYLDAIGTDADASNPDSQVTLKNLAYLIYTSGSTGTPKGVEIEHQGLLNLVRWHQQEYQVRKEDRATQLANLCFDASVWELWPYLTTGASVHIPAEETRLNPGKLVQWLAAEKITLSFLPTPLAEAVMDGPWPEGIALRALLTGGDRLRRSPRQNLPFQLVNHYGPTENSVVTTAAVVQPQNEIADAPPIGRPIRNTRLYILDPHMRPVPVGVPGELYIAGLGLARGYLNRPELTAEKFIANPFCDGAFSRLYRTGDLVRYREDGNIEFLGRIDQQVKLRGHRIELGEIETLLSAHAGVRETIVVARGDESDTYLAAYIVLEKEGGITAEALRGYLKQKLPEHMVPTAFVLLDVLPLTPNGKVDRKALPAPNFNAAEKNFIAPRNQMEEMLAGIWCELLHLERVGVHDNFFQLGGHSLLATQLISRVCNAFGVELPLQTLFDAPTVGEFRQLLEKAGGDQSWSRPVARRRDRDAGADVALSFAQERLWFLEQLEPGLGVYNVPVGFVLDGKLDIPALEQSLNALVLRHGSLLTSFGNTQGLPTARPAKRMDVELRFVTFDHLLPQEQEAEIQRVMDSEAAQPFNLSQAPLLRTTLLRLGSSKHVLLLTTHHIVSDGWSMGILYRELRELYDAYTHGASFSLPELPIQFDDYAAWQREWLQGRTLDEQLAFWKRQLQGPLPALDLPSDHPRPAEQSHRGGIKYFALPNNLYADLKTLCRREDSTLFMLLLAAFQTLLHRYSGQSDIITGTTVAGRTRVEVEGLVGLFLNTLALRTDMSGGVTFRELLQRVRRVALEAYAHQDVPFEKIVEALGVDRDLSRSPVFQAMFILQQAPLPKARTGEMEWRSVPRHTGTSKFDLTLSLEDQAEGLGGYLEYDRDLFEPDTVLRMLGHFQTLLEAVVANPDQKLSDLPLLTRTEQEQLAEWNQTQREFPRHTCIHELFEQQVVRTPNSVAAVFGATSLPYRELNIKANALARHLQSLGAQPGVVVGICVERSLEMLIALLAVLKAGAAYLPLDPRFPTERLAYMLEDSRAAMLVTQTALAPQFRNIVTARVLLDEPLPITHSGDELPSMRSLKPEDVAYVIYTSGSTGKPKGVVIPHRAVVNFLASMAHEPGLARTDVLVAVTTLSFDIAVLELLLPLTIGARVVIANHDETVDGAALDLLLRRNGATVMQATPVTWRFLLEAGWSPAIGFKALVGGEALPKDLADTLIKSGVEVWNMYGPTETTVWSTCTRVSDTSRGISIGKPVANTVIRILDEQKNLCPIGVPGELYIGGDGVAVGYWNRPELTAERFIPDAFSQTPGTRLYRTGDRARWRSDGMLEHLGRLDFQVKLRGFRIELGEIEATLARHPLVGEAVVAAREDTPGDKRLVAYVVVENSPPDLADQLRTLLRASMPEYMVPSHFVALKEMPRTHNGKLDRKALPAPAQEDSVPRGLAAAPRTPTEEMIRSVFCTVLERSDFGIFDNFFDLGGHSLMAARLMAKLRSVSGVDVPLRDLFARPSVAGLAEAVDSLQWLLQSPQPANTAGLREEFVL